MAHHGWSHSRYLRKRSHRTRNRLQTQGSQLRNSPGRSEGLGTQNRKCPTRPGLQSRGCSPRASGPGAARYGSLCLKPFLYLKDGLTPIKTPAKLWVPCSETLGEVQRDRLHKMGCAPAHSGLHAQGCILPWLIRAEASPCTPQKRVSVSHTASRTGGLS